MKKFLQSIGELSDLSEKSNPKQPKNRDGKKAGLIDSFKEARRKKLGDVEKMIDAIEFRCANGLDPESDEYKDLSEQLEKKKVELDNLRKVYSRIEKSLEICTPSSQVFGTLMTRRREIGKDIDGLINDIAVLKARMEPPKPGTPEFEELRRNLEQELKNKKLCKELRAHGMTGDKIATIAVVLVIAGFAFALDMESPKATKIAQFVLKLPILKF